MLKNKKIFVNEKISLIMNNSEIFSSLVKFVFRSNFINNKKAVELSIKAIVRLIIALAVLFLVVFPACNKLRSYFFGADTGSFDTFVEGINEMSSDGDSFVLRLNEKSAVIGFGKTTDRYECYRCTAPEGAMGFVSLIILKPAECGGDACACLCSEIKHEYKSFEGGMATVGECQKPVCRKLNPDIVNKLVVHVHPSYTTPVKLAELLKNPNQYINLWINGFLFANGFDEANELNKLNNEDITTLYVEKKGNLIGVCNKAILDYNR